MRMKAVFVFVAAIAFAAGPFLVPGFGGFDPNLYPDPQVNPPVQPATYAFAIWGLIYLWLLVHAAFSLFARHDALDWDPMRLPLIVALVVGASWLPVAMMSPIAATILIFIMLIAAIIAMDRAPILDPWLARAPVALFAGWLTAASFASLGLLGGGYDIVFDEVGWAYIAILGAFIVALYAHGLRKDAPFYPLGVAWALIAIASKNWASEWGVCFAALAGALVLLLLAFRAWGRHEAEPYHA